MRLLELEIQNIKAFKDATVVFGPGVNGLLGGNGVGKTTIQQAIGYTLFNHLSPAIKDFVREGHSRGSIRVRMRSTRDNLTYDIHRTVGGGAQNYVYACDDGFKVCEGTSEVLAFVEEHLGTIGSPDMKTIFRNAVGIDQGTFQSPFLMGPASRKDHFGPLLGIEKYRRIDTDLNATKSYAQDLVSRSQATLNRLEGQLMPFNDIKAKLSLLQIESKALQAETTETRRQRDRFLTQLHTLSMLQESVQEVEDSWSDAQMKHLTLQERVNSIEKEMNESRQAVRQLKKHERAHQLFKAAELLLDPIEKEIQIHLKSQSRLNQLQGEQNLLEKQAQERQENISSLKGEKARFDEIQTFKIQEENIRSRLDSSPSQESNIVALEESLNSLHRQLEENKAEKSFVTADIDSRSKLENELAGVLALQGSQADIQGRLRLLESSKNSQVQSLREQLEPLKQACLDSSTSAQCPICEQELSPEILSSLTSRLDAEIKIGSQALTELQQRLEACAAKIADLIAKGHSLKDEMERCRLPQELSLLSLESERLKKEVAETKQALEGSRSEQLARHSLQKELDFLRPFMDEYDNLGERLAAKAQWQQDLDGLNKDLQDRKLEIGELKAVSEQTEKLEVKAFQLRQQKEECQSGYLKYASNESSAKKLEGLETEFDVQKQDLQQIECKLAKLNEMREDLNQQYDPLVHATLRDTVSKLNELLAGKEATLKAQLQNLENAEKELARLANKGLEHAQVKGRLKVLKAREERVVWMKELMRQALPRITSALIENISKLANDFYCQLMEDHTRQLQWDSEFGILLSVNGEERSFRQLSGGEQMAASLAVTMALLRRMSSIRFVFLDEPTVNLDVVRRGQLASRLRTLRGIEQIFVISHDDTFEEHLDHVIRLEAGPEGSRIVMDV